MFVFHRRAWCKTWRFPASLLYQLVVSISTDIIVTAHKCSPQCVHSCELLRIGVTVNHIEPIDVFIINPYCSELAGWHWENRRYMVDCMILSLLQCQFGYTKPQQSTDSVRAYVSLCLYSNICDFYFDICEPEFNPVCYQRLMYPVNSPRPSDASMHQ